LLEEEERGGERFIPSPNGLQKEETHQQELRGIEKEKKTSGPLEVKKRKKLLRFKRRERGKKTVRTTTILSNVGGSAPLERKKRKGYAGHCMEMKEEKKKGKLLSSR